jgi:hypothetical protein
MSHFFLAESCSLLTHIKYDQIKDLNENRRNLPPLYSDTPTAFFGQLLHIFVVELPPAPDLDPSLQGPTTYLLAAIHRCEVDARSPIGMPSYQSMGRTEVVDLSCVQCLIGRVWAKDRWVILDRSGAIQQAVHVQDE